jgi:hypothetical protein
MPASAASEERLTNCPIRPAQSLMNFWNALRLPIFLIPPPLGAVFPLKVQSVIERVECPS